MEGLATWWPLEFDNISLRFCDIDRGSFAFGAVTGASQSGFHTIGFKTTANTGLVKGIDSETEVIQTPPLLPPALDLQRSRGGRSIYAVPSPNSVHSSFNLQISVSLAFCHQDGRV
jgi:hypothetical protein